MTKFFPNKNPFGKIFGARPLVGEARGSEARGRLAAALRHRFGFLAGSASPQDKLRTCTDGSPMTQLTLQPLSRAVSAADWRATAAKARSHSKFVRIVCATFAPIRTSNSAPPSCARNTGRQAKSSPYQTQAKFATVTRSKIS